MNVKHKGLSYVCDEGTLSRYTVFLEGRRVLDVLVDNAVALDADEFPGVTLDVGCSLHRIMIAPVGAMAGFAQETKGAAVRAPHFEPDASGAAGIHQHIVSNSVTSYVWPRLAHLLARVYGPPLAS